MSKEMHPIDVLCMKAKDLQTEPVVEYIRTNYSGNELLPIMTWIVGSVNNDDYIFHIYDEIAKLGPSAYSNSTCRHFLFEEPLECAMQINRPKVVAKICEAILRWSPFVIGRLHAIELACRTKNMRIVDAYIKTRGIDFIKDPEVIKIILQEDYVDLMDFCLKLKLDRRMKLPDGKNLYESAVSDEMRELLDDRTAPTKI